MNRLWRTAGLAVSLLVTPALPGIAPPTVQGGEPAPVVTEAREPAEALAAARRQRTEVVVTGMTNETRLVKAHPDGAMSAELTAKPMRVARGDRWVDIDPALVRRGDGSVGPRASTIDLAFSGGGKQPLVRIGVAGGSIALTWPDELPAPEVAGPVATYREVLPGVDLRLRADGTGYVKHLIVRTAEAAKNPALERIRLQLATQGVTLGVTESGGTEVRDPAGNVVMTGPAAVMWDNGASNPDSPGESAVTAPVKVHLEAENLYLVPDEKLLKGPETRFPLVIDPSEHTADKQHWTKVFSGKPGARNWDGGGLDGGEAKVGYCGWSNCNDIGTVRNYWIFDTGFLEHKYILDSRFTARMTSGPDCTKPRNHVLYKANTWHIDGGTDWNNQPGGAAVGRVNGFKLGTTETPGCGQHDIVFASSTHVNQGHVDTFFVVAENETDRDAWRKYDNNAKLWVKWNTKPNGAHYPGIREGVPTACENCGGKAYSKAAALTMQAYLDDPDGDQLYADWDLYGKPAGSNEFQQTPLRPDTRLGSGNWHSQSLDQTNRHGQEIAWYVRARDGFSEEQGGIGPWVEGPGHWFVDRVGVANPPTVNSPTYPDDNRWHGGAGVPGDFTFTANGVDDVNHFLWGWTDPPTEKAVANRLGGETTIKLVPPGDGPKDLFVRSVDKAGNEGPITTHRIYVRGGNGPLAQWSFEGNAKDTAFLGWRDANLHGGVSYTPGAVGHSVTLNGTDGRLTATPAVRADAGFSVAAWARLDHLNADGATVVSQGTDVTCGFCLQYEKSSQRWVFVTPQTEAHPSPGYDFVRSTAPPVPGEWTHLAGVFDKFEGKMRLYVNGVLQGEVNRVPRWHGMGTVRIGHTRALGGDHAHFPGSIDEVKIYDRPLSAAEVRAQVGHDNVQLGYWKFDDEVGSTTAVNAVPGGAAGVLSGDAKFVPGQVNGAVKLGVTGSMSTGAPVIRTDRSFTVAAWLTVDTEVASPHTRTAISQDGTVNSGFFLGYRNQDGGKWEFYVPSADTATRPLDAVVHSGANSAKVGQTAHVAAVYDAPAQQIRIYVDGWLRGTAPRTAGFNATGPLRIGGGLAQGNPANPWSGVVDELRAYSRVLSEEELQGLVSRDAVAVGRWAFDGNLTAAPTRFNGRDTGHRVDFTGGHSTLPVSNDFALQLNGANYVSADRAVDSSRSFSVAAWARLDKLGDYYPAVVSQDGQNISSFQLHALPDGNWAFSAYGADSEANSVTRRLVGPKVQQGAWTHLVATYNAVSRRTELYVNGVLTGSMEDVSIFNHAAGELQIGSAMWARTRGDFFHGAIDDVSVWSRPLFAEEVKTMAGRDLSLAHQWKLDEPSGRNTADGIGTRGGTLSGDAKFTVGRVGNAVQFDGTGDTVTTTGVDVGTDKAFTISAWVKLTSDQCVCKSEAVGIPGKLSLGHVKDNDQFVWGAWYFEMPEADGRVTKASLATKLEELGAWVHLAGVYDPATKMLVLYVDAVRHDEGTLNTAWNSTGGVVMGRTWIGDVDDVRLYTGALDNKRLSELYHSYPAENPPAQLPVADAGQWKFDEGTGTTAADSSGRNQPATIKGGFTWTGGRQGGAPLFDGTTGFAETAGPVLHTDRSFSASAWVYLTKDNAGDRIVLGQDGLNVSVFDLRFDAAAKKWAVVVPDADSAGANRTVLLSTESARPHDWIHLAVTYDSGHKQLRLYVNGVLSAYRVGVTVQSSAGKLSIGRGRANGANTGFFPQAIDDVRVYSGALSGGEVRMVHDDLPAAAYGHYRFDQDDARDYNWRKHNATPSGGVTYGPGIAGRAMYLDGTGSAVTTPGTLVDAEMDSFGISAWAKLSRDDKVSTIVSQDGQKQSGFVLQYRPGLNRWVFGQATSDSDGAPMVYAHSLLPPTLDRWTHVQGVYDYPAKQLRIYIDGQLSGVRDDVNVWRAFGPLALGRAKENSKPHGFFHGAIDEVHLDEWELTDAQLAERVSWPLPQTGQLGRYVNLAGDRYMGNTNGKPREGYRFDAALGVPAAVGAFTATLYECVSDKDVFASRESTCEGGTNVGEIGRVYAVQPTNLATLPLHRCLSGTDRFESVQPDCEGGVWQRTLGFTVAYAALKRHYHSSAVDHYATVNGAPLEYRAEGTHGYLGLSQRAGGTLPLYSCMQGVDQYVSTLSNCEGGTVLGLLGYLYSGQPAGVESKLLLRCTFGGQRFTSTTSNCENQTVDTNLGWILVNPPTPTPEFPPATE